MIYAITAYIAIGVIIYFARVPIAKIFSDKDDLIDLVSENLPYMVFVFMIHGTSVILGGAIRGLGMQKIGIWIVVE
jgi:Na+-driven multidrug efflux pump